MEILLSMRSQTPRSKNNSLFVLNLFALQFISLIALSRLDKFYRKIAQLILLLVDGSETPSKIPICVHFALNIVLIILFFVAFFFNSFKHRFTIIRFLGMVILNFKYIFLIPVGCINVKPLISSETQINIKIFSAFNMVMTFLLSALQLYTNWSNRFLQKDYCNRRQNSILCLFFQFSFVFSTISFGSLVGSLFLIAVSIFRAYQVAITVEYPLIQSSTFFYSSLNIYMCIICLSGTKTIGFLDLTFKLVVGVFVCGYFSKYATNLINVWYGNSKSLYNMACKKNIDSQKMQQANELENQGKPLINYKDIIIFSRILLSRMRTLEKGDEAFQWDLWWQKYSILLVCHKMACNNDDCTCKKKQSKDQIKTIIEDMRKLMSQLQQIEKTPDVRIMQIYLNIQIANRPLKGYYQIMKMRNQQVSVTNLIDLQCLVVETRQCFNRLFVVNNIQNINLPLLKILKFQQSVQKVEFQMKMLLQSNINFMELFAMNSIKIAQIKTNSKKIFQIKQRINQLLEDLVSNYPDSLFVNFFVFIFYQYLEVYRTQQKQLKAISQQKNLKKRLFQKQDYEIFSPEFGVIYIDLIQERGKIKKITKNICRLYGHNYQDMLSFNINQFMPRIFAKNHNKFLANFIQMGKIKLLAEKKRVLFGKNKNKFIFPIQVRIKTQHLLNNQFGVTSLIRKQQTGSQFIMFSANGKIEQISEKIFKIAFMPTLKGEVDKIRRLNIIKMIPNLVRLVSQTNLQKQSQKVYESLLIFTNSLDMVDKFKNYKQSKSTGSTKQTSSYLSSSADLENTSNQASIVASGLGDSYYAQVFKSFLCDINIVKLVAFNVNYRLSKIYTQEFSLFLLQIVSVENVQVAFPPCLQQYKDIAEYLSIYQQHGNICQNFIKFKDLFERNDVLHFMFNKNISNDPHGKNDVLKKIKTNTKVNKYQKKKITIMQNQNQNQNNQPEELIQDSDIDNFDDLANGLANQQQLMPKGGSERSSVSNQSQSQSKKQMLINAFNSTNSGISKKFILFINFIILVKFSTLLFLAIKSIFSIQLMRAQQLNNILSLQIKSVHNFKQACNQIQIFFNLRQANNFTVTQYQRTQQMYMKQQLRRQFTQQVLLLNELNSMVQNGFHSQLFGNVTIYDIHLKKNTQITIFQLLNILDFRFRSPLSKQSLLFLQHNYLNIDNRLKTIIENEGKQTDINESGNQIDQLILIFGIYEFMTIVVILSWIPIFFIISKQQKRILDLLSTMNIKQMKKAVHKLKFLWQNFKIRKVNQIHSILAMLSDQKAEIAVQMQKQKSLTRSIRLVYQNGSQSIKPKHVSILMAIFVIIFSGLPLAFYLNVNADNSSFIKTLNVIRQTFGLADKAPTLVNLYLININKIYNSQKSIIFPQSAYDESLKYYFNLQQYISKAQDLANNLINENGSNIKFSINICQSVPCSTEQKIRQVRFYDEIIQIKNKLSILSPDKLKLGSSMNIKNINDWAAEVKAQNTLTLVTKIFQFCFKWTQQFKKSIQHELKMTKTSLIVLSSLLLPIYIVLMVYIEYWVIKKMGQILKDAQSVHMHFPVHVLAQNTYLSSYFNDKIKNNK